MYIYEFLPEWSGDGKFSPTKFWVLPLENSTVGNTGVRPFTIAVESKAFGANYSGWKLKLKMVIAFAAAAGIRR